MLRYIKCLINITNRIRIRDIMIMIIVNDIPGGFKIQFSKLLIRTTGITENNV